MCPSYDRRTHNSNEPTASSLRVAGIKATSARRARLIAHVMSAWRDLDAADRTRTSKLVAAPEIVAQEHGPPEIELRRPRARTHDRRDTLELRATARVIQCNCNMQKDFDRWNKSKKKIDAADARPFYHAREIWWCAVGVNVSNELDGTGKHHDRPVLVIRPFNAETFFGIALVGHPRAGRYYFSLGKVGDRDAVANLSQARLFDTKRLIRKIRTLDEDTFRELAKTLALTLFPFLPLK